MTQITKPKINEVAPARKLSKPLSVLPINAITIPTIPMRSIAKMAMKTQSKNQEKNIKENQLVHAYASLLNIRNDDLNYDDDLHIAYCVLCAV